MSDTASTRRRASRPPCNKLTIRDDFASLDDWEDRYRYVIELGHTLEPLGEAARNERNKVRGCLIASTGHSGSQTPQSMHSSGWMTSMFSPS